MRALLVPLALALVVSTGCGANVSQDDDVDPERAAVETGLARLYGGGAEGECFAVILTDQLPLEDLVDAGIVGDDGRVVEAVPMLTVDVATAWVGAAGSCAPYADVAARAEADRSPGLDPAAYADCLGDAITPDRLRAALVASLSGGLDTEPAVAELIDAQTGCRLA